MTVNNLFAVLLGDKMALKGGSGKVVNSGPNDHIFLYYSDHGGPGVLGELLLAGIVSEPIDFIQVPWGYQTCSALVNLHFFIFIDIS